MECDTFLCLVTEYHSLKTTGALDQQGHPSFTSHYITPSTVRPGPCAALNKAWLWCLCCHFMRITRRLTSVSPPYITPFESISDLPTRWEKHWHAVTSFYCAIENRWPSAGKTQFPGVTSWPWGAPSAGRPDGALSRGGRRVESNEELCVRHPCESQTKVSTRWPLFCDSPCLDLLFSIVKKHMRLKFKKINDV